MFKHTLIASAIAVSGSLLATAALAEASSVKPMDTTVPIGKISEWIGMDVKDQQGNNVGEIADFAVNLNDASIPFVVVQLDPMFSAESIAVPLSALRAVPGDDSTVSLAASSSQWQAAAKFDKANWPTMPTLQTGAAVAASQADTGLVATSDPSASESAKANQDREFERMDRDGDGYLSATEIKSRSGLSITRDSDTNQDGRIDRAEFSAFEAIENAPKDKAHETDHP